MRTRAAVFAVVVVSVTLASHDAEASAILFNDRGEFDAALNGDYQLAALPTVTDIQYSIEGQYAGLWLGSFIGYHAYIVGQPFMSTGDVTAIGFDLVSTSTFSDTGPVPAPELNVPFYQGGPPPDVLFSFKTVGGIDITATLTPASFFGVMLVNDRFSDLAWYTNADCGFCVSTFTLGNVAVQSTSVPEPSSGLLFGIAASLLVLVRRKVCDDVDPPAWFLWGHHARPFSSTARSNSASSCSSTQHSASSRTAF
jgi:hypothetical protein